MMMWADYIRELGLSTEFIENEFGFIAYELKPEFLHIHEVYTRPEFRLSGHAIGLIEEAEAFARRAGLKFSVVSCAIITKTMPNNLRAALAVGFVPYLADGGVIWLRREIKGEA